MSNFGQYRNVELSTVDYFTTQIAANWTGVSVVVGYPNLTASSVLPIVSIRVPTINSKFREIGARTQEDTYTVIVDVFAKSHAQRMDLAQFLENSIIQDCTYYNFSRTSGQDDTQITKTSAGLVKFLSFVQNQKLEFGQDVDFYDRFRQLISYNARVALT